MVDLKLCFTLLFSLCRSGNSNFSSKNGDLTGNLNLELPLLHSFLGGYFGVDPLVERSCIWQGEVWKHHSNPSNISESPTSKGHVGQVTPLRDEVTILDIRVLLVPGEPISNHSKKKRRIWKTLKNYITPGAQKKILARNKISWSSFRGVTFSSPNSPTCWKWYSWAPHDNASHLFDTLEGRCCEPMVVSNPSQVGRCGWCHYTMMPVETWRWRGATPPIRHTTTKKKSKYRGSNGLLLLGILWSYHGPFHNLYHPGVGGMHLRLEV